LIGSGRCVYPASRICTAESPQPCKTIPAAQQQQQHETQPTSHPKFDHASPNREQQCVRYSGGSAASC
jgi:hypothetical protein